MGKKGISHTLEHRKKISKSMRGERNGNWTNTPTSEIMRMRNSHLYRAIRKEVAKRDDETCQECGARNVCSACGHSEMHVDHIKSAKERPDLFFEMSNMRILCLDCHKKTDNFGHKVKQLTKII